MQSLWLLMPAPSARLHSLIRNSQSWPVTPTSSTWVKREALFTVSCCIKVFSGWLVLLWLTLNQSLSRKRKERLTMWCAHYHNSFMDGCLVHFFFPFTNDRYLSGWDLNRGLNYDAYAVKVLKQTLQISGTKIGLVGSHSVICMMWAERWESYRRKFIRQAWIYI